MKKKYLIALALLAANVAVFGQSADEVIGKYIQAIGGQEKWKNLKSIQMEGKISSPQGDLPVTFYQKAPNKTKFTLNFQGQEFVMAAFDGATGWFKNPMQGGNVPTKMDEEQSKELALQEFENSFIDYKKKGHAVTLEGKEEIEGVQCYKVKLEKNKHNDKEDVTEYYYIDTENHVPIMQKYFVRSGPSKGAEMLTYLSDYQEVNGLMVPFFMEQKVNGQSVGKITIQKIELNKLDDKVFTFPN
jgi:outer membrane lipoprotein-sorting protein